MNVIKSRKQRVESIASRGRDTVSRALSVSVIQGRVKHGQMRFIHSFVTTRPNPPPPTPRVDTVLRRTPRSLGSALRRKPLSTEQGINEFLWKLTLRISALLFLSSSSVQRSFTYLIHNRHITFFGLFNL